MLDRQNKISRVSGIDEIRQRLIFLRFVFLKCRFLCLDMNCSSAKEIKNIDSAWLISQWLDLSVGSFSGSDFRDTEVNWNEKKSFEIGFQTVFGRNVKMIRGLIVFVRPRFELLALQG